MEDAISQLQVLGVTRGQAKKALARYNNDVARAADYIFSGNVISDDEADEEQETTESDEQLAIRLSAEEQQSYNTSTNSFNDSVAVEEQKIEEQEQAVATITQQNAEIVPSDSSQWSVVPFKSSTELITSGFQQEQQQRSPIMSIEASLTWWKDPENPSDRVALDDLPIGLRPPSYNFAYSPIILQALFHISAFQRAVLSYRPTACGWGASRNYWKGFGEAVPGYMMKQVVTKRRVLSEEEELLDPPPSFSSTPFQEDSMKDLISLDDDVSLQEEQQVEINESLTPIEIIEPTVEELVEYVDHVDNEMMVMPKCLHALAEMQKVFAFLGNTKRLYGSASHFVRALNTKLTTSSDNWEFSDKSFDTFLDMMIQCLVEADEQAENAIDPTYMPIFRNFFLVKARIEFGDDYDEEEVYYLTLNTDKHIASFHDCLDPLVFESYDSEEEEEEGEFSFKFTTFKQTPPILMVVLENSKRAQYKVDKTIYMDRYMIEKKDIALDGFKEMESCRKQIITARKEIDSIKHDDKYNVDKRNILAHTIAYFEQKQEGISDTMRRVLTKVIDQLDARVSELEWLIVDQREKMHHVFDREDMKQHPYELRASFHHDGKSGTGHYWAYIWMEPSDESLLQDIPSEGGWFRFCDAHVTTASEYEVMNDPTSPFSLMYVDASLRTYTRQELYECIPQELKNFLMADKALFEQEIHAYDNPSEQTADGALISTTTTPDSTEQQVDDFEIQEIESSFADMDMTDDTFSVGTAAETPHYSFTGQGYHKLKDRVQSKIVQVAACDNDDYRLVQSFETFLARTQNQLLLEHLYLLYSSEQDGVDVVDEEGSRQDDELKTIWQEYESYLCLAEMMTKALTCFVRRDYTMALQCLLDTKRQEAGWKTQVLMNMDIVHAFSGLTTISFTQSIETYGKACLKILNDTAYIKASNPSYCTRGLEDAIRIANQAQTIIGPDQSQADEAYQALGLLWFSFAEQANVILNDAQSDLLNTLVMCYLEGSSVGATGGITSGVQSRSQSPTMMLESDNLPLWQKYQQVCIQAKQLLLTLE